MRIFHIRPDSFIELEDFPEELPPTGFLWAASGRREFEVAQAAVQAALQRLHGGQLVDLHVADLLNNQLPSQFDYTSWYDFLVFRRLAAGVGADELFVDDSHGTAASARRALEAIDTSPVGFAVFDRILLTVHPTDCQVREAFIARLSQLAGAQPAAAAHGGGLGARLVAASDGGEAGDLLADAAVQSRMEAQAEAREPRHEQRTEQRMGASRMPPSPADLMLRIVNHMVDGYLALRRLLTRQLGYLQSELLSASGRFDNWQALLESRNALHMLEDICEDQRSAVQEWIDALDETPIPASKSAARERDLLRVRSRDVLEHIERVLGHVRRLESSAEGAVQMHFSVQSNRTNDIMRTLTALTAIFLPLNLITGIFGMNFDALPLIHDAAGFWVAALMMLAVCAVLIWFFWRKRYLGAPR
ncbi:MAG: magnesium transporter CorA family protein [Burkholderiales bacterium]|nr:magnesium transporter CorA family protein [Burkholderiales bacterium]